MAGWRILSFSRKSELCPNNTQIVDSDRRKNFEKKCAIDRHLSTDDSPKLRLWRLFDRKIYTSVLAKVPILATRGRVG